MKKLTPHFSRGVAVSLATLFAAATCAPAFAAVMHSDVAIQTYTDFGQNMGRYTTSSNALLNYIRERDGGVRIDYTGGQDGYVLEHGLIDFESTGDNGALGAIGYNFIATVRHNGVQNPTFSGRVIGDSNAIRYATIEYRYDINQSNNVFSLSPTNDYKIARTSKLITDVTGSTVYSRPDDAAALSGQLLYRAGSGTQELANHQGQVSGLSGAYNYIIGGIAKIDNANNNTTNPKDWRGNTDDSFSVKWTLNDWSSAGINEKAPLPTVIRSGDSGSPGWIWNDETGQYEYLAAGQSGGGFFSQSRSATEWTIETMASFDKHVALDASVESAVVTINAVDSARTGTTVSCDIKNISATPVYGSVTDASGNELTAFSGVSSGVNTWNSLSDLKDKQNWYTYGNSYLNGAVKYEQLFLTENLVFDAAHAETTVNVGANVDLGIGYVRFTAGDRDTAKFTVSSSDNYQLNSAGYIVDKNVDVHITISNSDQNYIREWRKIGDGNLHLAGTGNNQIFLNVGGNGKSYLEQSGGYAAYNVLANNGATVVIKDVGQIARDFTFGAGGGVLDMNGNSMDWFYENTNVGASGFSINALTEEAIIANNSGASVLTFRQSGNQTFKGSFRDTETSSLKIVYDAGSGSSWTLNSVFTDLKNSGSGLDVKSGTVVLAGTNTVHGVGSETGKTKNRYTNADDWHYADATMNVSIASGATFRLGTHARLTGDVTVADGGTFVMREGVKHDKEYIEGGLTLEDTSAISAFYGLKGNVALNGNAEMRVEYNAGTTATTVYAGRISGTGKVKINLGETAQTFRLAGDNSGFSGDIVITSGNLVLGSASAVNRNVDVVFSGKASGLVFASVNGEAGTVYELQSVSTTSVDNYARDITVEAGATVYAGSFRNAWGLDDLQVEGRLSIDGELKFATGRNASTETNRITGAGTVSANSLVFGNIGTYNIDVARIEVGSGGMRGNGDALNFGTSTLVVSETWTSASDTNFTILSGSKFTVETENSVGEGTSATLGGYIGGAGDLVKTGAGTLSLTRNNLYFSGQVIVEEGTLQFGGITNVLGAQDQRGAGTRFAAVIKTGGTLDVNGKLVSGDNCYKFELAGGALINNGSHVTTDDRQVTGLKLSADSQIGGSGNFGIIGSGYCGVTIDLDGHTLTKTGSNVVSVATATFTAGTLRIEEGTIEIAKTNSNASEADLVLAGGNLSISDQKEFSVKSVSGTSGTLNVASGKLSVGASDANGAYSGAVNFANNGEISFVGGTHDWTGISRSAESADAQFSVSGEGTCLKLASFENTSVSVASGAILETTAVTDSTTFDMSGVSGDGTVALNLGAMNGRGVNLSAFTGTIEVRTATGSSVGRLRLNTSDLNSAATIKVLENGELVFDGTGTTVSNSIEFSSDSKIHANQRKDGEISGNLSGASGITLTKAGGGVLTLSGDNSGFAGAIVVTSGVLKVTNIDALGSGAVRVTSGATLQLSVEDVTDFNGVTLAAGATLKVLAIYAEGLEGAVSQGEEIVFTASEETLIILNADGKLSISGTEEPVAILSDESKVPLAGVQMLRMSGVSQNAFSIPEPSAFGLLAGLGAIALVASRRRRNK